MSARRFDAGLAMRMARDRARKGATPPQPTDDEIEALAGAMYDMTRPVVDEMRGMMHGPWATASEPIKASWRIIARTAWARGAR